MTWFRATLDFLFQSSQVMIWFRATFCFSFSVRGKFFRPRILYLGPWLDFARNFIVLVQCYIVFKIHSRDFQFHAQCLRKVFSSLETLSPSHDLISRDFFIISVSCSIGIQDISARLFIIFVPCHIVLKIYPRDFQFLVQRLSRTFPSLKTLSWVMTWFRATFHFLFGDCSELFCFWKLLFQAISWFRATLDFLFSVCPKLFSFLDTLSPRLFWFRAKFHHSLFHIQSLFKIISRDFSSFFVPHSITLQDSFARLFIIFVSHSITLQDNFARLFIIFVSHSITLQDNFARLLVFIPILFQAMTWFRATLDFLFGVCPEVFCFWILCLRVRSDFARLLDLRSVISGSFLIFGYFCSESWLDFARLFIIFVPYLVSFQDISARNLVLRSVLVKSFSVPEHIILGIDLISRDFSFLARCSWKVFSFPDTFVPGHILISRDF